MTTHLTSPNKQLLNSETRDATLLTGVHDVLLRPRKAGSMHVYHLNMEGLRSQALGYEQRESLDEAEDDAHNQLDTAVLA